MNSRESIESTLQRVQAGDLSPTEATRLLLAEEPMAQTLRYESLASLLNRLGAPPRDLIESWCRQLAGIASCHERETGRPFPKIDLDDWYINSDAELLWKGRRFQIASSARPHNAESVASIRQFRNFLLDETVDPTSHDPVDLPVDNASSGERRDSKQAKPDAANPRRVARRTMLVALTIACIFGAVYVLYNASQPASKSPAADTPHSPSALNRGTAPVEEDLRQNPGPLLTDSTGESMSLETIESMSEAEISKIEAEMQLAPSFSLDELMPPAANFVASKDEEVDLPAVAPDMGVGDNDLATNTTEATENRSVDELLRDDEAAPQESPQEIRSLSVMAVQLPSPDSDESTVLSERQWSTLQLDFPYDVPLKLTGDSTSWQIHDTRQDVAVADVTSDRQGSTLQWTEKASESPNAAALAHGRLSTGAETIYLRPAIEADAWSIRVDRPDVMPTWNLAYPIPPRITRVSLDFQIPDVVDKGWIEPIDPESVRRGRGLAVLTPKDGESVSLGLRFDIRCSRKLSCRIRYAGRLDPTMPWQVVSVPLLEQFADQLTHQAMLVSNEADRLSRVYELAGSAGRRILRIKQERNDARADAIRTTSQRVAQLQSLIAILETEGSLNLRVWVEWPDSVQEILTMSSPERE